ncbi:major facilitator superfamily domain-containing protein [Scheffersomyces xylosifermentans]|uniref:major facilitator superfamily domain-containing protein n=1 Tax=Scheffersomyces xylosifermentans TaxID=1304137 RepID=UPI00315D2E76
MLSPVVRKVFLLLSCTFLGLICGTLYLYSSYSPQFAMQLKYSVSNSSSIALCGTIGVAFAGPLAGIVVDKKGYTISLIIGGLSICTGYLGMKQQYDMIYSSVTLSGFFLLLIGAGSTFINSACLKCCAVSFPSIRGVATSLPLALYGLSALFYSVIASIFFPGDTSKFLGFISYSSVGIFIICAPSIMVCDYEKARRPRTSVDGRVTKHAKIETKTSESNLSGLDLMKSHKFWLLFIITGALASLGQMYIYSVGYMVKALITYRIVGGNESLNPSTDEIEVLIQKDQQIQVGLISVANCVGRILSGILGDIFSQSFNKPRSMLLFIPSVGLAITQLLGEKITDFNNLPINSLLTGLFYGFTFCIMPIIIGDTFGMENFSFNWGIVSLAPVVPSFYFTSLFGTIYDSNSQKDDVTNRMICLMGNGCYNTIFSITFFISAFSVFIVWVLNFGSIFRHLTKLRSVEKPLPLVEDVIPLSEKRS